MYQRLSKKTMSKITVAENYLEANNFQLTIQYEQEVNAVDWFDYGRIYEKNGVFVLTNDKTDEQIQIGEFRIQYIPFFSVDGNSLNFIEIADGFSADLFAAAISLPEETRLTAGLLYIDRFFIKPEFRSHKLGYLLFPALIDAITNRGQIFIAIIPDPLNDMLKTERPTEEEREEFKQSKEYKEAIRKMTKFIKNFGFVKNPKNSFWITNNTEDWDYWE